MTNSVGEFVIAYESFWVVAGCAVCLGLVSNEYCGVVFSGIRLLSSY